MLGRLTESPLQSVKRRDFITLLGGAAAAWPLAARAQERRRIDLDVLVYLHCRAGPLPTMSV